MSNQVPVMTGAMLSAPPIAMASAPTKQLSITQRFEADPSIPPNHTIYIKNLNDRVKLHILKPELNKIFEKFGKILDIVAMSSFWRKGQAWIVFEEIESATNALKEMQGYLFHGHSMHINYALEKSDVITKAEGTFTPRPAGPKKPRAIKEREEKQRKLFQDMQNDFMKGNLDNISQPFDPETAKALAAAQARAAELALLATRKQMGTYQQKTSAYSNMMVPNRTLFVESLPEGVTTGDINNIFSHMPGFVESRVIPSRRVAFVDFDNEHNSGYAMQNLQGHNLNGSVIVISFAKR